jgi:hypothetical protein
MDTEAEHALQKNLVGGQVGAGEEGLHGGPEHQAHRGRRARDEGL